MKHALLVLVFAAVIAVVGRDARAREETAIDSELRARMSAADADPAQLPALIEAASAWIAKATDGAAAVRVGDQLDPYLRRAFFSPLQFEGMNRLGIVLHKVEAKQLPKAIAKKYRIDAHLLPALNDGYDDRKLKVGQQLKVLDLSDGSLDVVVDKPRFRMFVWRRAPGGATRLLLGVWPVGLGKESSATPTGQAVVVKRVRDPEWTNPDTKKVHKHGDPGNVLGGYWIALDSIALGRTGIGLHGYTGKPAADWIEQKDSHGCVRLLQEHISLLFDIALDGTPVTLREELPPPTPQGDR